MSTKEWFEKGIDLTEQGNHEETLDAFDEAIEIDPKLLEVQRNRWLPFINFTNMKGS